MLYLKILMITFTSICVVLQVPKGGVYEDIDSHLNTYAKFNLTHHDNIDDTNSSHSHKHKHGPEDEEHEHEHNHAQVSQSDLKIVDKLSDSNTSIISSTKSDNRFFLKNLLSFPHPSEIFRPPIS